MSLQDIMKKNPALAKFAVSEATKSNAGDPVLHQRDKFTEAVQHQLDALEAEMTGKAFVRTGMRKDKDTGESFEKQLRFKKWWQKDGNRYIVTLRYGASPMFAEGIVCPTIDDVMKVFDSLIEATKSGSFDSTFTNFKRGPRKPKNGEKQTRNIKNHN